MEERGYLMDCRRDFEETFEPIVACNEKMAQDIIKDLAPINEELVEMNRNIELKREMPKIGSKCRLVSATMVLSLKHLSETIWLIEWIRHLVYASRMENS